MVVVLLMSEGPSCGLRPHVRECRPDLPHCPTIDEIGVGATRSTRQGVLAKTLLERANQRATPVASD